MNIQQIRGLRLAMGLSQRVLAQKTGISCVLLRNYERGILDPDEDQLNRLADFFKIPIDFFKGEFDDNSRFFLLTQHEYDHLEQYRKLPSDVQSHLNDVIADLVQKFGQSKTIRQFPE